MFTLEIGGQPIAVIQASTREEAEAILTNDAFREDLTLLDQDGQPLWDGRADLIVREASVDEISKAKEIIILDANEGRGIEDGMDGVDVLGDSTDPQRTVVFLVPLTLISDGDVSVH